MRHLLPLLLLGVGHGAFGQPQRTPETIVVTATRTERNVDLVPATVTVIDAEELERQLAREVRDLVRYEPGISVGGTGDRFGPGGITIRGIGGNRVLTMIDGVRVADGFSFGPFLSANRDYVDIDALRTLEIVRGPGSALYGSDALGGVVAYRTKDARDYLNGDAFAAGFKTGYSSVDDSAVGTLTLAAGGDAVQGLLLYTRREAHETENFGTLGGVGITRELPDPLDIESDNVMLKLSVQPSDRHRLTFGADLMDSRSLSQVLSDYDQLVGTIRTLTSDADDTAERRRVSVGYTLTTDGGAVDRIDLTLYQQTSEQAQRTSQERLAQTNGARTLRRRDSFFDQEIAGLGLQVDKRWVLPSGAAHYFVAGLDYWSTDSASMREGGSTTIATGAFAPEGLPTRDFPLTSVDQYGVYLQDEIALLDARLLLTPSVRFDSFDATATADAIYRSGNPGQPAPADFDDSEASPKVGMLYKLTEVASLYAQYAEGFRAPPYDDVNVGFTNLVGGYKSISNPDLESERSRSVELGARWNGDFGALSLVAFRNRYDNFIESQLPAPQFAATGGVDPSDGLLTFQSLNLAGVEIDGVELSGRIDLGASDRFALNLALARSEGTDKATGAPLNSIDPLKGVFGVRYAAANGRWGGDLVWTVVASKDAGDINGNRFATAGYGLVDLLGYRRFGERVLLNFGLFNLGDKQYIDWADTAAITYNTATQTYPEVMRFTRPGFNAGLTLRVEL